MARSETIQDICVIFGTGRETQHGRRGGWPLSLCWCLCCFGDIELDIGVNICCYYLLCVLVLLVLCSGQYCWKHQLAFMFGVALPTSVEHPWSSTC